MNKSLTLSPTTAAHDYPWTPKRTWQLTKDDVKATKREGFFAIQVSFTGSAAVKVCIDTGLGDGFVNPIIVPYTGAIIPVCGNGFLDTGNDVHGTFHTTAAEVTTVIAFGGDKVASS